MAHRRGEKIGWTAGWLGGFLWAAVLAVVFLFQEKWARGAIGLGLVGAAVAIVASLAPWRHPSTPYWRLMLPPYLVLLLSAAWAIWAFGGASGAGLSGWSLLWVFPLLIPLGSVGQRKWADTETPPSARGGDPEPRP